MFFGVCLKNKNPMAQEMYRKSELATSAVFYWQKIGQIGENLLPVKA
jgi:hypothetical protein